MVETSSTASAVQVASERSEVAAIASALSADLYAMPILEKSIQDKANNVTRFLVVGNNTVGVWGMVKTRQAWSFP